MKNVLIAFDKFKDALSAHQACQAAAETLASEQPKWSIASSPLADGGDGFSDTLTRISEGEFAETNVSGPLGQNAAARYGIVETRKISADALKRLSLPPEARRLAIIEFAQSSGIALVPQEQRSPWTTSSFGLGQTIADAQAKDVDAILLGLGGSATNDLALGALQALGYQFFDTSGTLLRAAASPEHWQRISRIQAPELRFPLPVRIACDVENPLLGPNGATAVFGPQKGLAPNDFAALESEMSRLAALLCESTDQAIESMETAGSGAAGGAAFGIMLGLGGQIISGAELVFDWSNLHEKLDRADIVITGEGRFDASSLQGKGPGSLAAICVSRGKELFILAGCLGELPDPSIAARARAISPTDIPLVQALADTKRNIEKTIRELFAQ